MIPAPLPANETARLAALDRYDILDTPAELEYDDFTALAAQICGTPIALLSLVDAGRQWFKSKVGLEASETPRELAFCAYAIHGKELMEVANAADDPRFFDNPLVTGAPDIRFYAGVPLTTPDGFGLGTLCVIDRTERRLSIEQRDALTRLGRQVVRQLEFRLAVRRMHKQAVEHRAITDSIAEGIHHVNLAGHITYENPASARMLGRSCDELLEKPAHETIHHSHADGAPFPKADCPIYQTMHDGVSREVTEDTFWRADGTAFPVDYVTAPLRDVAGRITGVTVAFRDLTDRRRIEDALVEAGALIECADEAILTETREGVITRANPAAERLYGYASEELVGRPYAMLIPPSRTAEEVEILAKVTLGKVARVETERTGKDGATLQLAVTVSPIKDAAGRHVGISNIAHDISERKHAEKQEREHLRLFAFEAAAALALTQADSLPAILRGCADAFVEHLDAAFARIWTVDKDGTMLELKASAGLYTHLDGGHARVPIGTLKIGLIAEERKPHLTNAVVGDPRVTEQAWAEREGMVAFAGYPLIASDRLVGVMAMFARQPLSPLTTQAMSSVGHSVALAIERSRVHELLQGKNEELKGFAYTVSHDLKAPLRGIMGYAQELERKHKAGLAERAQFCVTQVMTATRNLDRLIEDLLQYSRLDREFPAFTSVDLDGLVQSVLRDLARPITERGVEVSVALTSATLVGWERGIRQIIANLIDNALKYSKGATPPRLTVTGEPVPTGYRLSVKDNGIGFDMKYHDRMFGLFNRLVRTEDFEGTGAGLAIVKKVLEKQGGKIWAEGAPEKGATFFVELPTRSLPGNGKVNKSGASGGSASGGGASGGDTSQRGKGSST